VLQCNRVCCSVIESQTRCARCACTPFVLSTPQLLHARWPSGRQQEFGFLFSPVAKFKATVAEEEFFWTLSGPRIVGTIIVGTIHNCWNNCYVDCLHTILVEIIPIKGQSSIVVVRSVCVCMYMYICMYGPIYT